MANSKIIYQKSFRTVPDIIRYISSTKGEKVSPFLYLNYPEHSRSASLFTFVLLLNNEKDLNDAKKVFTSIYILNVISNYIC